jgi:hypothetical protein
LNEIEDIAKEFYPMKNYIFSFLLLVAFSFPSLGWGPTGHRVVGSVAEKYLNKKTKKALLRILNGQSVAMASTWLDEVRSDSTYNYTADWHWVTIPDGQTYDQSEKNPKGDIIETLERIIKELKSKKLSAQDEAQRIKILIHLVGDIHQPLHVGAKNDKGGNDVKVMWFKTDTNLHHVWDSDMIDDTKLSYTELAQSLDKPTPTQYLAWQKTSVRDWAKESQSYQNQVYDYGNGKLGYRYSYLYLGTVRQRLLQSGVRLAGILNEIYGK